MSQVVGSNSSYKPITNAVWVHAQLCKLQKGCTLLTAASDKAYQLLAQGRWFSPGTPASSTTKTGRHDIAENGVKHQKFHPIKRGTCLAPLQVEPWLTCRYRSRLNFYQYKRKNSTKSKQFFCFDFGLGFFLVVFL